MSTAQPPIPIDIKLAHAYVDAFAKKRADKLEYGTSTQDGSFGGLVSNVRLDFDAPHNLFIVRALSNQLYEFDKRQDVWVR